MKFSVGDKMLIKRTGEEGIIVSLLDNVMAEVKIGKTIFPIHLDEIDHPYLRWFTQKNKDDQKKKVLREQIPVERLAEQKTKVASGIHLAFMPVFQLVEMEEQVERVKIFFINHSHYTISVHYQVRIKNDLLFTYQGVVQPFADLYLHYIDWEMMQQIPRFEWKLTEALSSQYAVHQDVLKIRSAKLFEHITAIQANNTPTFQYTLIQEFGMKEKEKEQFALPSVVPHTPRPIKSIRDIPKYEVDLHIEQLVDGVKGLSNSEILYLQLAELEKYLQIAINNKQDRLVVIHGVGKGVLRNEVQKLLQSNVFVARIESGWQAGYGFGATIAYLHY